MAASTFLDIFAIEGEAHVSREAHASQESTISKHDKLSKELMMFRLIFASGALPPGMGYHIPGCSGLLDSISNIRNLSVQCFLTPSRGAFPNYDIPRIRDTLIKNNLTGFSHLPYFINLCKPQTSMYPDPIESLYTVIRELRIADQMGLFGAVIHTGKDTLKKGFNQAWEDMKYYTLWCVCHATVKCPLLLETCCGAGSEILANLDDYISFYEEVIEDYPSYYQKVFGKLPGTECPFGLVADTCHIFVSGYENREFIERIVERIGPKPIKLFHYNDAKNPKGSHKDAHMSPGTGTIPLEDLYWVYNFAIANNIPMVRE